jgi:hypothetical protein
VDIENERLAFKRLSGELMLISWNNA